MSDTASRRINRLVREHSALLQELTRDLEVLGRRTDTEASARRTILLAAIRNLGPMYSLAVVATAEAELRDFLGSSGEREGLAILIDRAFRRIARGKDSLRAEWHEIRRARNAYAHGD